MSVEFQVPSPLVPTRESYFVRYCKQNADGTWAVVDVSLDGLRPGAVLKCRRRPSGCLIQEMPNGYSKVTWVEHVEVDDRSVHSIYKLLVSSGLAFGARRWVGTLDRQCERLASVMASNIPTSDIGGEISETCTAHHIYIHDPKQFRSLTAGGTNRLLACCSDH
jgi:homeobox-leucine zipper protein